MIYYKPLTKNQKKTLEYMQYNPETNDIETNRSISTVSASTLKTSIHSIDSGGANVFFTNENTNTSWFPAWTGLKDQSLAENQDAHGVVPPKCRYYTTDLFDDEINGIEHLTEVIEYQNTLILQNNTSFFIHEIITEEDIQPEDFIFLEIRLLENDNPVIYSQKINGVSLLAGERFVWRFEHPIESYANTTFECGMYISKDNEDQIKRPILVRASSSDITKPYIKCYFRNYQDYDIQLSPIHLTQSSIVRASAIYAIDTALNIVNLTAFKDIGYKSFDVFDADNSFNLNNCVINFDNETTFTLNKVNDYYKFYLDENNIWRYLDMNTKSGGLV